VKKSRKEMSDVRKFRPRRGALARARKAIAVYTLIIQPDADLGYAGYAMELPSVMADGQTAAECAAALNFSLETALAAMIEGGMELPRAQAQARRTEHVNTRLTPMEKQALVRESSRRDFGEWGI